VASPAQRDEPDDDAERDERARDGRPPQGVA
jgi:hypothetical protein